MADRPRKKSDPLDESFDILPPDGEGSDPDEEGPEPDPSDLEPLEPEASGLDEPDWGPEDEEEGWAAGTEVEDYAWELEVEEPWDEDSDDEAEEPGARPGAGVWIEEDAAATEGAEDAALWAGLEDESAVLIGHEELVDLPALGRAAVLARISTLVEESTLLTPDLALLARGHVETPLRLAGIEVPARLVVAEGPEERLVLGRAVLAGRFLIDPGRRRLVSPD